MARSMQRLVAALVILPTVYFLYSYFLSTNAGAHRGNKAAMTPPCYTVEGFSACPYFQRAKKLVGSMAEIRPIVKEFDREAWQDRKVILQKTVPGAQGHSTSPFVWSGGCEGHETVAFIGGYSEFQAYVDSKGQL
ncbi:hypothetical protein DFJ77DRAFT_130208 [Powellomyces hirtus]|nr:hypothetical protein DFJ77DRAFT_130208 [Powellomyces hirtus]